MDETTVICCLAQQGLYKMGWAINSHFSDAVNVICGVTAVIILFVSGFISHLMWVLLSALTSTDCLCCVWLVRDNWDKITDFTGATYPSSMNGMLTR